MKLQKFLKRQMDFWGSLFLLVVSLIPLFIFAALIKWDSQGPVIFRQQRLGRNGTAFTMLKFRTMVQNAASLGRGIELEKDDWRVTRVGKWLRRFRIDEFPQLIQVMMGEMSLVGPRPGFPHHFAKYTALEKKRLAVVPGMASMDMLKGGNLISWKERIQWDIWYIDHWSVLLDLRIIWGTFWVILSGKDEYGNGVVEDYK